MSDAMAPLKIVMVEDVESDAEITLRELKRGGLRVELRRVETEMELVRECDEFDPDVVLSDFALPNFDGWKEELSTIRISDFAIGISSGPRLKKGWPKARTCFPSL